MNMEQEILTRIDAIAAKLGVASEHVWEFTVRQQSIEGWTGCVIAIIGLVLLWSVGLYFSFTGRIKESSSEDRTMRLVMPILRCFFLSAVIFCPIYECLVQLLNPEYAAFHDLVRMLK